MALVILSSLSINNLINCITSGDVKTLSQAKGVGKKTAERIIVELKGKLGDLSLPLIDGIAYTDFSSSACDEACELLVNMGLSKFDALKLIHILQRQSRDTFQMVHTPLFNAWNTNFIVYIILVKENTIVCDTICGNQVGHI